MVECHECVLEEKVSFLISFPSKAVFDYMEINCLAILTAIWASGA